VFTRALRLTLSWGRWIQSVSPHLISLIYILILSSHRHLVLPSGLFPSGFPTKILYAFLFSHACYMPCLSHPSWFDYSNCTGWRYYLRSTSSCSFIHSEDSYQENISNWMPESGDIHYKQCEGLLLCERKSDIVETGRIGQHSAVL
jgi:hypothetical protein